MFYDINFDKGIMNMGDTTRLRRAMARAMRGEPLTIGFLGGSITQGCASTTPETCYAYLVYDWWVKKFPQSVVSYVNAGIGGTPSDFGVARVDDDLLRHYPDFSIVEFSVNDAATDYYMETYEGLVRHILKADCETALMLVHNVRYDNMESAEDKHLIIGKYYDLPDVSMKHSVYPEVANKTIPNREITADDLHPNDAGHRLLADLIINYLEKIYAITQTTDADTKVSLRVPKPLTQNGYETSIRYQNINCSALGVGFKEDLTPQSHITEMFRHGYTAWHKGDRIIFKAECSSVAIQYRKSVNKPTPIARAVVDQDYASAVMLDGNFDEDWGDCLYTQPILKHGELKEHLIEIQIVEDHAEDEIPDAVPFYLVSVIASKE